MFTQLSDRRWKITDETKPNILRDLSQVIEKGQHLKRWIVVSSVAQLPLAMVFPFSQVYAHEIKSATPFVLGAMVMGSALTSVILAIPLGRLADKIGRKEKLYTIIPLFWASNLLLVISPNQVFLVIAGIMQGFFWIGVPILAAMERELVPPEHMGRWLGIVRFCRMLLLASLTFLSGIIWNQIGPQYVFFSFIVLDLVFRLPILISMPETIGIRFGI